MHRKAAKLATLVTALVILLLGVPTAIAGADGFIAAVAAMVLGILVVVLWMRAYEMAKQTMADDDD